MLLLVCTRVSTWPRRVANYKSVTGPERAKKPREGEEGTGRQRTMEASRHATGVRTVNPLVASRPLLHAAPPLDLPLARNVHPFVKVSQLPPPSTGRGKAVA